MLGYGVLGCQVSHHELLPGWRSPRRTAPCMVRLFHDSVRGDLDGFAGVAASGALTTRFLSLFFFCFWRAISVSLSARGDKKPTWALPMVGEIEGSRPSV